MLERKGYVYRFIGANAEVLYVGKTVDMPRRMKQHFSEESHLAHTDLYKNTYRIEYMKCATEYDALRVELYFINLYKPRYNTDSKIKNFISKDRTMNHSWKVYKVLKEEPIENVAQRERIAKYMPVAMAILYFGIIGLYLFQ